VRENMSAMAIDDGAAFLISVSMCALFLLAGTEKLRSRDRFEETLRELGIPAQLIPAVVVSLPASEIVVGISLVLVPSSWLPKIGALILAISFAIAGVVGMFSREPVRCSCLGSIGEHALGKRQLYALPVWLLGLAYLEWVASIEWTLNTGAYYVVLSVLTLTVLKSTSLARRSTAAHSTRQAMSESNVVRPSMFQSIQDHS